jgi:hypothetical protein
MLDSAGCELIDLTGRHPGLNERGNVVQHGARNSTGWPHCFEIPLTLDNNHRVRSGL